MHLDLEMPMSVSNDSGAHLHLDRLYYYPVTPMFVLPVQSIHHFNVSYPFNTVDYGKMHINGTSEKFMH